MEIKGNHAYLSSEEINLTGFESPIEITSKNVVDMKEGLIVEARHLNQAISIDDELQHSDMTGISEMKRQLNARMRIYRGIAERAIEIFSEEIEAITCDEFLNKTQPKQ